MIGKDARYKVSIEASYWDDMKPEDAVKKLIKLREAGVAFFSLTRDHDHEPKPKVPKK